MSLRHIKLRTKFLVAPIFISLCLALITLFFYITINQQFDQMEVATRNDLLRLQSLSHALDDIAFAHNQINVMAAQASQKVEQKFFDDFKKQLDQKISQCNEQLERYLKDQELQSKGFEMASALLKEVAVYHKKVGELFKYIGHAPGPTEDKLKSLNQIYNKLSGDAQQLVQITGLNAKKTMTQYQDKTRQKFQIFAAGLAVFALMSIAFSWGLAKQLLKPILDLLKVVHHVTKKGDFTARAAKHTQDEIGALVDGFNHMLFEIGRTEDIYKSASDQFKLMLDQVGMLFIMTDEKGLIKFLSHSALDLIKKSRAQILNHALSDFLFEVQDAALGPQPLDAKNLLTKKHQQLKNVWFVDEGKQVHQLRLACSTLEDANQNHMGLVLIGTIVKDKKLQMMGSSHNSSHLDTSMSDIIRPL